MICSRFVVVCVVAGLRLGGETTSDSALRRARQFLDSGQVEAARGELETAKRAFPQDARVVNLLGAIEAMDQHPVEAEACFREAARLAPRFVDPWLNLGRLSLQEAARDPSREAVAASAYDSALRLDPTNVEALYQSAYVLVRSGKYSEALVRIRRLPSPIRQRAQSLAVECTAQAGAGNGPASMDTARRIAIAPDLTEADVDGVLPALWKVNAREQAFTLLDALNRRGLASNASKRRLAVMLDGNREYEKARELLEEVRPVTADLLLDLARVAHRAGDLESALGYLAHARDLDQSNTLIHYLFGVVCAEMKLPVEAEKSLQHAVQLGFRDPVAHYVLGWVIMQSGRPSDAVTEFQAYHDARPGDERGALALGAALWGSGRGAEARLPLAVAAKSHGTAAAADYFLGRVAQSAGDSAEAIGLLEKAVAENPSNADAWAQLGLLYTRDDRFPAAERALNRCLKIGPDNLAGNLNLYVLYQRTGHPRATAQRARADEIREKRSAEMDSFWRTIRVSPWEQHETAP